MSEVGMGTVQISNGTHQAFLTSEGSLTLQLENGEEKNITLVGHGKDGNWHNVDNLSSKELAQMGKSLGGMLKDLVDMYQSVNQGQGKDLFLGVSSKRGSIQGKGKMILLEGTSGAPSEMSKHCLLTTAVGKDGKELKREFKHVVIGRGGLKAKSERAAEKSIAGVAQVAAKRLHEGRQLAEVRGVTARESFYDKKEKLMGRMRDVSNRIQDQASDKMGKAMGRPGGKELVAKFASHHSRPVRSEARKEALIEEGAPMCSKKDWEELEDIHEELLQLHKDHGKKLPPNIPAKSEDMGLEILGRSGKAVKGAVDTLERSITEAEKNVKVATKCVSKMPKGKDKDKLVEKLNTAQYALAQAKGLSTMGGRLEALKKSEQIGRELRIKTGRLKERAYKQVRGKVTLDDIRSATLNSFQKRRLKEIDKQGAELLSYAEHFRGDRAFNKLILKTATDLKGLRARVLSGKVKSKRDPVGNSSVRQDFSVDSAVLGTLADCRDREERKGVLDSAADSASDLFISYPDQWEAFCKK